MIAPARFAYANERPRGHVRAPRGAHVKRLGRVDEMVAYAVDGELLRREVDIDFVLGGSPARYSFVPSGELWVDACLGPADATATLLHEYVEYMLMTTGHLSYDEAHDRASEVEQALRVRLARKELKRVDLALVARVVARGDY